MSTIKATNITHASSPTPNIVTDTSGNVTFGGNITFPDTTTQSTAALGVNVQTFDSSGTWTKPSGYAAGSRVYVQAWGAGGSGGRHSTAANMSGGGGGGYNEAWFTLSALGATETITIGAGGASRTGSNQTGATGGTTTVGSLLSAYGGGGGGTHSANTTVGGGGGGMLSAGTVGGFAGFSFSGNGYPGLPQFAGRIIGSNGAVQYNLPQGAGSGTYYMAACAYTAIAAIEAFMTGGGGGAYTGSTTGGTSVWGGGGGGGGATSGANGGESSFGGNGGAAGTTGTAGSQPGGGGGGGSSTSGAGGDGRVIITVFPA